MLAFMQFSVGHGTENDFVVLPDLPAALELSPARVAALCDRRRGLGADGVLRVARAGALLANGILSALPAGVDGGDWFMDYRNADGSIAEMCGNGVRVFAHYLAVSGLEQERRYVVGSRAGARPVTVHAVSATAADVTVEMGVAQAKGSSSADFGGRSFAGIAVDVGNPHLACIDPGLTIAGLSEVPVGLAPRYDHGLFPDGVNVSVATALDEGAVSMRVHERGAGETRSCGTATVAVALAALRDAGQRDGEVLVRVPGGEVAVRVAADGSAELRGPSVLLASGDVADEWWSAQ